MIDAVVEELPALGIFAVCLAISPAIIEALDLSGDSFYGWLCSAARVGRMTGGLGFSSCSKFPRARHQPLPGGKGPKSLRPRSDPFVVLPGPTTKELFSHPLGTLLMLRIPSIPGDLTMPGAGLVWSIRVVWGACTREGQGNSLHGFVAPPRREAWQPCFGSS